MQIGKKKKNVLYKRVFVPCYNISRKIGSMLADEFSSKTEVWHFRTENI
jgi:hypothetical protein